MQNTIETGWVRTGLSLSALLFMLVPLSARAQAAWTAQERLIAQQIQGLRGLPDDVRARTTRQLALEIRQLPAAPNKVRLAYDLANLSTEGDFGHDTLQEVTTTLADALQGSDVPSDHGQPAAPYVELAQLVRYEHVQAPSASPQFTAAMSKLVMDDERRSHADFTLRDLAGNAWTLENLRGKVVLLNFWATWCPPCRKEIPDLEALYNRFQSQGLVVLGISDEDAGKVRRFVTEHQVTYPILLDPGRSVSRSFDIEGIPRSFVYDRDGKLVSESIDMRTYQQFLQMLARAGLR